MYNITNNIKYSRSITHYSTEGYLQTTDIYTEEDQDKASEAQIVNRYFIIIEILNYFTLLGVLNNTNTLIIFQKR